MLRVIGYVIVAILVIHILLTVLDANQANAFATFIRNWANTLSLGLCNLFSPADAKVAAAVNYGLAALISLLITNIRGGTRPADRLSETTAGPSG